MICDCQRNILNCEENVRRFLGVGRQDGSIDLAARDELIENMTPLIERIIASKLQNQWRQDRANVVQETYLKLCDPAKVRTWLESSKRTWFCHWVAVVAYNTAIDWIRRSDAVSLGKADALPGATNSQTARDLQEQAEELRRAIIAATSEFELEWQLVFCMKFSYFEPSVADIAPHGRGIRGDGLLPPAEDQGSRSMPLRGSVILRGGQGSAGWNSSSGRSIRLS